MDVKRAHGDAAATGCLEEGVRDDARRDECEQKRERAQQTRFLADVADFLPVDAGDPRRKRAHQASRLEGGSVKEPDRQPTHGDDPEEDQKKGDVRLTLGVHRLNSCETKRETPANRGRAGSSGQRTYRRRGPRKALYAIAS